MITAFLLYYAFGFGASLVYNLKTVVEEPEDIAESNSLVLWFLILTIASALGALIWPYGLFNLIKDFVAEVKKHPLESVVELTERERERVRQIVDAMNQS